MAIEHASRGIRLSPLDPFLVGMQSPIAFAYFCAGRYDQSAAWAEKAVKEQPTFAAALRVLAASSASLGWKKATEALVRLKETKATVIFPSCDIFLFGSRNILRNMPKHCEKPASRNDTDLGFQRIPVDVRYWHKADIPSCTAHVRFTPESGHDETPH